VKRDEGAGPVWRRELLPVVDQQIVGSPVRGEGRDRRLLAATDPDGLPTVTAVLRSQDELLLRGVVVALRPAVVRAALQPDELLRREVGALLGTIEMRPVLRELIAPVLGRVDPDAGGIDRDASRIAEPRDEALVW